MPGRKQNFRFVMDCSIALAWHFEDEADDYAYAVQAALDDGKAHVPTLWTLEVANALVVGERRGRTTTTKSDQFLSLLFRLPISVEMSTAAQAWNDALRLARTHAISVYDASYLELALRLGVELATLDEKLKAAAGTAGAVLFRP